MSGEAIPTTSLSRKGEEFRADERRRKPVAHAELEALTRLNPVKATIAIAKTVGLIGATLWIATVVDAFWILIPAIVVVAVSQQALFVLVHDAAHYRLYSTRWLNDAVGRVLGMVVGISMCTYRVVHRLHHNHLYSKKDPDIPLIGGYPRGRRYLQRKLLGDLAGFTAFKTYSYFFGAPVINDESGEANRPLTDTSPRLRRAARLDRWFVVGFHVLMPAIAWQGGFFLEYLLLWILPALTVLQFVLRLRAICEHGAVDDTSSPLTAARTNLAPWWLGWAMFPHHVNYHIEHHLYPAIPHYNLPACHKLLMERGALDDAQVLPLRETMTRIFAERDIGASQSATAH